ncbi:uncharacterized protein JCM6883_007585 [Sporobolomyces salmoneus]|uniref:uncharacterized protein n=1 Tax=Sporobolomyces salmoneus TaxID=183962 RepID=UPI003172BCB9
MADKVETDDPLESTTKHLNAVTLHDPPATPKPSQATLLTLPPELLLDLFTHLPSSFVLPPLASALLPFHRSQLYRSVTVNLYQFDTLQRTLQSNKALCGFVENLTLNFHPDQNDRASKSIKVPRPVALREFIRSLPNLKTLFLSIDSRVVDRYYPKKSDFANDTKFEKFSVKSFYFVKYYYLNILKDLFDWEELRSTEERIVTGELYEEQVEPNVHIELEKRSDQSFGLRYLTTESTEINIHSVLREFPLSRLQLVAFTHCVHLGRLLQNIGQPLLLTNLSLFSFDETHTSSILSPDYLSRFPNLTHLALGGTALLTSPEFFESLSRLPLESLHVGPHAHLQAQALIDIISPGSKLTNFRRLILDNFDSEAPAEEDEEDADLDDWEIPDWTPECSEEKVKELKELAENAGIEIDGSTIEGLRALESEAYQAALRRAEDEDDDDDDDDEDEDDEEDIDHDSYEDEYDSEDYDDLHDRWCGCDREYEDCRRFRKHMGWPRQDEYDWY